MNGPLTGVERPISVLIPSLNRSACFRAVECRAVVRLHQTDEAWYTFISDNPHDPKRIYLVNAIGLLYHNFLLEKGTRPQRVRSDIKGLKILSHDSITEIEQSLGATCSHDQHTDTRSLDHIR